MPVSVCVFVSVCMVNIPCMLANTYSKPFMAFTWLLLKRANPNSCEMTTIEHSIKVEDGK